MRIEPQGQRQTCGRKREEADEPSMRAHGQSRSAAARHYALVQEKGGQRCRPPLFFVSFVPFAIFVIFVIFVLIVLIDDQCRTAIERQGRLL